MELNKGLYIIIIGLFAMVCLFEGVTSDNVCDDKWKIYYDNCYLFSELFRDTNTENWSNARTECDDRSANLAAIEDQDTWDWVVRQISSLELSDELWIGLYKSNNEYDWDDGTHPNTSNFFWVEPEHGETLGPNTCVYATTSGWRESLCSESYHYICYKPVPSFASWLDVLVITIAIIGSIFGLLLLVWVAYSFFPESEISHEKLDKNIQKTDKQEAKEKRRKRSVDDSRIQEDQRSPEVHVNKAYAPESSTSGSKPDM